MTKVFLRYLSNLNQFVLCAQGWETAAGNKVDLSLSIYNSSALKVRWGNTYFNLGEVSFRWSDKISFPSPFIFSGLPFLLYVYMYCIILLLWKERKNIWPLSRGPTSFDLGKIENLGTPSDFSTKGSFRVPFQGSLIIF